MPHFPKPYFRKNRQTWTVQINGHQHNLGRDRDAAFKQYHELMATPTPAVAPPPIPSGSVLSIIDKYLDWCKEHRSAGTFEWYRWRLQHFADSIERELTMSQLRPFHIDEAMKKAWSGSMKHGVASAIQRAFRWAMRKGYIEQNPVAYYEKARRGKRTVVISSSEFDTILPLTGSRPFQDLLLFTWETAARPQESIAIEARHVDFANARIVFPVDESKGDQWPRSIYLTQQALEIVRRLILRNPEGPIFRNCDNRPWTAYAVNCAFCRLQIRMGLKRMKEQGIRVEPLCRIAKSVVIAMSPHERRKLKEDRQGQVKDRQKKIVALAKQHGKKYCLYNLRHSWLDRALKRGVDALTCAILMGHRDPSTISKVYQHLSQSPDFLGAQARKAVS